MMKARRIMFAITSQSLICAGGIGQFAKGFLTLMHEMGHVVDLVCDVKPKDPWAFTLPWDQIIYTDNPIETKLHDNVFAFTDSINFGKEHNLWASMSKAWNTNLYDFVLCNTPECLVAAYSLGYHRFVQTMYYTHNENLVNLGGSNTFGFNEVGPYSREYNEYYARAMTLPGIMIGTQTEYNLRNLLETRKEIPGVMISHTRMPLPDLAFLNQPNIKRDGLLWIGRWEERKDPKFFISFLKYCVERNFTPPVTILTNRSGRAKFQEALKEINYPFEQLKINCNVDGKEKIDAINDRKIYINTSVKESFGYSVLEALGNCRVILPSYSWASMWHQSSDKWSIFTYNSKDAESLFEMVKLAIEENNSFLFEQQAILHSYMIHCRADWESVLNRSMKRFAPTNGRASANVAKIDAEWYNEYAKKLRPSSTLSVEDLEVVLKAIARQELFITQTKGGTWLHKEPNSAPNVVVPLSLDEVFA